MSTVLPSSPGIEPVAATSKPLSPNQRAWARFKRNRIGYVSLCCFVVVLIVTTFAELVSNDRPLVAKYDGQIYFPLFNNHPETTFGGDFGTPTDWADPFIAAQFAKPGNWAFFTFNRFGARTTNPFEAEPSPAAPSRLHWLGTDSLGQDMVARLLYGFRVSIWFAFALTLVGTAMGIAAGALQGYFGGRVDLVLQRLIEIWGAVQGFFGGKTDLAFQRFIEIWGSMPELYLLIIFSAVFAPSLALLLVLLSLFGWMGLSDYVRAEFLRNRQLDYVRAARALGVSNWQIILRHVLPNSLTPVVTFLPFRMSGAILALTSLDFLGLGVPPGTPSLGELLSQGKNNIDAWWISLSTFAVLVVTLLLLTFMGDALRDALDPRKAEREPAAPAVRSTEGFQ